ncbi:glycine zipper 2TM domain-containing protein [Rhizobium alvei]|uniref:17 kDa surface antigen n=1 Tax=Rhizobium alvei TaxID=1132659 RepID=A0ABT8YPI4_9HYPH|nr:glycine zipper 2TM domain-containing protein [Rhizobium alvei]MDO6965212.1 glycine zipper 2TM domain-containing protein [Rhizobium alvei]
MNKILVIGAMSLALASCTTTERNAVVGGVTGATVGAVVSGKPGGVLAGAAIGATAGVLLGKASKPDHCRYRDRRGRVYIARCP